MADLTAAKRKKLTSSQFALPGKGEGPGGKGSGSYPIPDEAHARNALARASGKPEEAAVRRAVKKKYPNIGKGSGTLTRMGQKTLAGLQTKYGDAAGKTRFHAQIKAGRLDAKKMLVSGGKD